MSAIIKDAFEKVRKQKTIHRFSIYAWFMWQFGFMIAIGKRHDKRYYVCFDIPLFTIQLVY